MPKQTYDLGANQAATLQAFLMSFWRLLVVAAYVLAFLLGPAPASAADRDTSKVSFYFAAHEDDWQLFMKPRSI